MLDEWCSQELRHRATRRLALRPLRILSNPRPPSPAHSGYIPHPLHLQHTPQPTSVDGILSNQNRAFGVICSSRPATLTSHQIDPTVWMVTPPCHQNKPRHHRNYCGDGWPTKNKKRKRPQIVNTKNFLLLYQYCLLLQQTSHHV